MALVSTSMNFSFYVRMVYFVCLAGASVNHARANIAHGLLWDYGGVPLVSSIFWTALTFLDPLAAILLLVRPRWGVGMTVAIIVVDVLHNSWLNDYLDVPPSAAYYAQVAFLILVASTAKIAWAKGTPQAQPGT
ncbi:hypothetical protein [Massilia sp. S19_KUP03_FR1]|uniref:hypothetical protein n=1 Tax=Massilia sp. S19_KUP03_FR1 TaxID=3025503 RepID=UPI002FCDBC46